MQELYKYKMNPILSQYLSHIPTQFTRHRITHPPPTDTTPDFFEKMADHKSWVRQGLGASYMCSTDPSIFDLQALNSALGSDMLWWAIALPQDRLETMIDNCLVLGLYELKAEPESDRQPSEGCFDHPCPD